MHRARGFAVGWLGKIQQGRIFGNRLWRIRRIHKSNALRDDFFHARRFCRAHQIARAFIANTRIANQRRFHLVGRQAIGQIGQLVGNHIGADFVHNFQQAFRVKRIRHHGLDALRRQHFGFGRATRGAIHFIPRRQQHFAQRQANHTACACHEHFCFCAIFVSSDKG